jgi:uncharacterized membrane protein
MSTSHTHHLSVEGIREYEEAHRPTRAINVGEVERHASTIAGTLLVVHGLRKGSLAGLATALLGGGLVYRGVTGHCPAYAALRIDTSDKHQADPSDHVHQGHLTKHAVTIDRPAADLYAYWRDVENAPRFMGNIESVRKLDGTKSRWVASGPFGAKLAWDSEIIVDEPGRLIAWKSLPGAAINQAGTVRFEEDLVGPGTVVTVELNYEPPAGVVGLTVAKLIGEDPDRQALENLRRFKQLMEAGEIPITRAQPSGRS